MANITVSVSDDVLRRARVHAAERGMSVSALVNEFLGSVTQADDEFRRLERLQHSIVEQVRQSGAFRGGDRLDRETLHHRGTADRSRPDVDTSAA